MVAMLSSRSAAPYMPDMPMHPKPTAETTGPAAPNCLLGCIAATLEESRGRERTHYP